MGIPAQHTYRQEYSGIVDALKKGQPLCKGHSLKPQNVFTIVPIHFELPKKDNLLTEDIRGCPKVPLITDSTVHGFPPNFVPSKSYFHPSFDQYFVNEALM